MRPTKEGHFHYKPDSVARVRIVDGELWFCTTHGWQGRVSMSDESAWGPEILPHDWTDETDWLVEAVRHFQGCMGYSQPDSIYRHMAAAVEETIKDRNSGANKWESDQRTILQSHGLAEEFPWGCDAMDYVTDTLPLTT